MRTVIKNSVMAVIATIALAGGAAWGEGMVSQQRAAGEVISAATSPGPLPLAVGDKLKVSFYETIDVGATRQVGADQQASLRTFYQRMDLSGDYAVEQDGAISIPLLGRFQVEGRAVADVRTDLAVSFSAVTGRSANIDVKVSDRLPIYVVGPVKNPGAYKYVPGMIVLHAIALAGGLDRGEGSLSGMIEGAREMERLRRASFQIKQLLARRARLEAERDGAATLPIPVQLANLAGDKIARTFVATENTILRAEQARRRQQSKEIALKVAAARSELEALKGKLDQIDVQKDMRIERLNDMQKLKDRGLNTSNNVVILRTELSDIEARRQDYLVAVVQAQSRLAEAEEADARLSSENSAGLAKAIATVDQEIAAAQEAMSSASVLASVLYNKPDGRAQTYEIVRQSKDGAKTLQATETSPLTPGDVLKVNPGPAAAIDPASAAPAPRPERTMTYIHASSGRD